MALSSVYKEKALGEHDVDVIYLNGWIAVFQTVMSLPMAIPTAMATALPFEDIPQNIYDGFKCYVGINTVLDESSPHLVLDQCGTAPYFVSAFIAFNLVYNVLIIVILKRGSSSLLYLSSTVLVPVNDGMFSLKFIPGHKPLHLADVLGLVVIMLGLLLYRCGALIFENLVNQEPIKALLKSMVWEEEDDDDDDDDDEDSDTEDPTTSHLPIEEPSLRGLADQKKKDRQRIERLALLQRNVKKERAKMELLRRQKHRAVEPPSPLLRESLQQSATLRRMAKNLLAQKRKKHVAPKVTRFFGPNQIEMLQPMLQAQRSNIRQRKARSSAQIRQDFLLKLGFSPDPASIDRSPARLQRRVPQSPGDLRRLQQQHPPEKNNNASFKTLGDRGRSSSFDNRTNLEAVRRARGSFTGHHPSGGGGAGGL